MRRQLGRRTTGLLVLGTVLLATGCGDSGDVTSNEPLAIARHPDASGDGQTGPAGERLPDQLRAVITRNGQPIEGVQVQWSTINGGSFSPGIGESAESGVAETFWTLGPGVGAQTATAQVVGEDDLLVTFTAVATVEPGGPPPDDGAPQAARSPE